MGKIGVISDVHGNIIALRAILKYFDDNGCDEADGFYASDFIGWTILDNGRELGTAEDFDDSTENLLLSVKTSGGKHIFVPLADELVLEADPAARRLDMDLPAGLFEL